MAGIAATFINTREFSIVGDRSSEFNTGRRVQAICGVDGAKYGTIDDSTAVGGVTIVTLDPHSDALTANLTEVYYGIVRVGPTGSMGEHDHSGNPGSGGVLPDPQNTIFVSEDGTYEDYTY